MPIQSKQRETTQDIVSFISKRYIIGIQEFDNIYKIFQIIFGKEGSIFINFPYYSKNKGIIGLVKFPGNIKLPTDLSLLPGGNVTTNLVKYSHHPDGNAHFSQSGKIFTVIRKKSVPLTEINGHLFTLMFQGLKDFKEHKTEKNGNKKSFLERKSLFFKLDGQEPDSIKIVGRIFTKKYFQSLLNKPIEDPLFIQPKNQPILRHRIQKNVYQTCGWVIRPPLMDGYGDYVLVISYKEVQKVNKESYSSLIFIGGFDSKRITRNHSLDTTFLSFIYPIPEEGYEELKNKIGCLDFRSDFNI